MTPSGPSRFDHIDAMRAFAVMLVVLGHAGLGDRVPGGSGVTIFFSISGFIITHLLLQEMRRTAGFNILAFYGRRALKILPPLIVVVLLPTLVLGMFKTIDWSPVLSIVLFYYNWLRVDGISPPLPGSVVVWSLSIEEQFYLLFAVIWLWASRLRNPIRWLAIAAVCTTVTSALARLTLASTVHNGYQDRIYYGSDTRIEAIALGVLTAVVFHRSSDATHRFSQKLVTVLQKEITVGLALAIFLASLIIRDDFFRYTVRFSIQALAACVVIVYGFGSGRTHIRRAFDAIVHLRLVRQLGLASYSIYLAHLTTMVYMGPLFSPFPEVLRITLLVISGTSAGVAVYLAIERPIQKWRATRKPD